jgi:hypothetical protein
MKIRNVGAGFIPARNAINVAIQAGINSQAGAVTRPTCPLLPGISTGPYLRV